MTGGIRTSIAQLQRLQCLAPAKSGIVQTLDGLAGLQKKDMIVIDFPGGSEACAKMKLSSQNGKRTWAQLNASILPGLGLVPIYSRDSRLVDTDNPILEIEVSQG